MALGLFLRFGPDGRGRFRTAHFFQEKKMAVNNTRRCALGAIMEETYER